MKANISVHVLSIIIALSAIPAFAQDAPGISTAEAVAVQKKQNQSAATAPAPDMHECYTANDKTRYCPVPDLTASKAPAELASAHPQSAEVQTPSKPACEDINGENVCSDNSTAVAANTQQPDEQQTATGDANSQSVDEMPVPPRPPVRSAGYDRDYSDYGYGPDLYPPVCLSCAPVAIGFYDVAYGMPYYGGRYRGGFGGSRGNFQQPNRSGWGQGGSSQQPNRGGYYDQGRGSSMGRDGFHGRGGWDQRGSSMGPGGRGGFRGGFPQSNRGGWNQRGSSMGPGGRGGSMMGRGGPMMGHGGSRGGFGRHR